ncbi:MAG: hypothetical protein JWP81_2574 [Ferruginibacter sp.]|nr:hypothetical protein [Ferruginibacter sp.]
MKQKNLLANFDYKSYGLMEVISNQSLKSPLKKQLPLLEVNIDFAENWDCK